MTMSQYRPGDVVARRKGLVMHKGIVMPDGRILHNTPLDGEKVCSLAEFSAGRRVYVTRCRANPFRDGERAVRQAPARPYCLFTNNCEHTVTRFTHGRPCSPQLRGWVTGMSMAAATLTLALTRSPSVSAAAYSVGRTVLGRLVRL
jgi:cell wall-associated NlpC family hydrolase